MFSNAILPNVLRDEGYVPDLRVIADVEQRPLPHNSFNSFLREYFYSYSLHKVMNSPFESTSPSLCDTNEAPVIE